MKLSVLATFFAAPLALAGTLQADVVARTETKGFKGETGITHNEGYSGGTTIIIEEIVLVWICMGGGTQTTTVNSVAAASSAKGSTATHTVSRLQSCYVSLLI